MAIEREIGIDPLLNYGPGCCSECGSPIIILDSEMTVMELNNDGDPIAEETSINVLGGCSNCGKKYKMMRYMGKYIPYSESSRIIRTMEMQDQMRDRVRQLNQTSKGDNPLAFKE